MNIQTRRSWTKPEPSGSLRLTSRGLDILRVLLNYRFLLVSLLVERFFSSKCFADRRLRKLYNHGPVHRMVRQIIAGRQELIYVLAARGAQCLASEPETSVGGLGWSKGHSRVSQRFMDHELGVNRFRFLLEDAADVNPG